MAEQGCTLAAAAAPTPAAAALSDDDATDRPPRKEDPSAFHNKQQRKKRKLQDEVSLIPSAAAAAKALPAGLDPALKHGKPRRSPDCGGDHSSATAFITAEVTAAAAVAAAAAQAPAAGAALVAASPWLAGTAAAGVLLSQAHAIRALLPNAQRAPPLEPPAPAAGPRPLPVVQMGRSRGAHADFSLLVKVMALAVPGVEDPEDVAEAPGAGHAAQQPDPLGLLQAPFAPPRGGGLRQGLPVSAQAPPGAAEQQQQQQQWGGMPPHGQLQQQQQQQHSAPCRTDLSGELLLLSQELSATASAAAPRGLHQQQQQQQQHGATSQRRPQGRAAGAGPGAAAGAERGAKRQHGRYIYGNYHKYYGYRLGDGAEGAMARDGRLQVLDPSWFEGRRLLDIGCNEGVVTLAMAMEFGCSRTDGVDIDPTLVGKACGNAARLRAQLHERMRAATSAANRPSGYDPRLRALSKRLKALSRVTFAQANWLDAPCPAGKYEVITVFSVTKWIHLNWGDEGLTRLFHKLHRCLAPGGIVVLEPQDWRSYHNAVHKQDTSAVPFRRYNELLKIRPGQFAEYLTEQVGFELVAKLAASCDAGARGPGRGAGGGRADAAAEAAPRGAAAAAGDAPQEGARGQRQPATGAAEDGGAAAVPFGTGGGADPVREEEDGGDDDLESLYSSLDCSASHPLQPPHQQHQRRDQEEHTSAAQGRQQQRRRAAAAGGAEADGGAGAAGGAAEAGGGRPAAPGQKGFSKRPILVFRKPLQRGKRERH